MRAESPEARRWLAEFGTGAESRDTLDRLVALVDGQIMASVPGIATDPTLVAELHASTRAHWRGFLTILARESYEVQVDAAAFDLARTLARRGFELPVLLSIYRVGQRAVWDYITRLLTTEIADADVRSAVLLQFWTRLSQWLDSATESMIVAFTDERAQWQRGSLARRSETVHAILDGRPVEADAASAALSYPLDRRHTAVVLWVDEEVPDTGVQRLLESAANAAAAALGGRSPLTVGGGARVLWGWVATPDAEPAIPSGVGERVHVAIGSPGDGVPGFRQSHADARAAQAIALRQTRIPAVTRYADVEIACLAAGLASENGMWAMVRRELGALAADDETTARLRETARLHLSHAGGAEVTAKLLNVHPNTVRYRMRQAEELLGHPIEERRVYVELALAAVDAFGP